MNNCDPLDVAASRGPQKGMTMHDYDTAPPRRKLCEILGSVGASLRDVWAATEAARDFEPLPAGDYITHVVEGRLFNSNGGTPGYKVTFAIIEGPHTGRKLWLDLWLTPRALPMAKRDLAKLGITSLEQLERPLPPGRIRCRCRVALRRGDDGQEYNVVRHFGVIGVDEIERDPFTPRDAEGGAQCD